jgi:hypothetical protein
MNITSVKFQLTYFLILSYLVLALHFFDAIQNPTVVKIANNTCVGVLVVSAFLSWLMVVMLNSKFFKSKLSQSSSTNSSIKANQNALFAFYILCDLLMVGVLYLKDWPHSKYLVGLILFFIVGKVLGKMSLIKTRKTLTT